MVFRLTGDDTQIYLTKDTELQGLGPIRHFRTSKGRKVAYVASANGRCVVAYRARYERGSDRQLEKAVADYVATVRDKWVKAA